MVHAKEWGRGWVVSHSSLIYYYSQQPGGSGYFPVLQIKKLNSEASQAPEYPKALVKVQCSEFPCGRPENLHFFFFLTSRDCLPHKSPKTSTSSSVTCPCSCGAAELSFLTLRLGLFSAHWISVISRCLSQGPPHRLTINFPE